MSSDDSKIYDKIRRRVIERGREIEETRERREELRFEIEALREVSDLPDAEFEAIVRDVCAEELNDLPKEVSEEILQDLLDGLGRGGAGDPSEVDGKRRRRRGRSEAPREERGRFNKRDAPQERRKSSGRRFVFLFGILFLIAGYLIFVKPPSLGEWDRGGLKVARKAKSQDENSLVEAAQEGHLEMVRQLVEAGVEPDVGHFILGQTPLMLAAENGDGPIVTFLLENGADARLRDPGGRSALDYAYPMSSESLVPILAKAYAEASPEGSIPRELWERGIPYSHEAFRESLQERNLEVVEIFLSDGDRDLLAATIYGTNTLMDGITAAAEGNRFDLVRRLVTEIEQRELTDRDRSRLAQALKAALYYEDPEAAKTLTDLGAPLVWPAWARSGDSLPPRTLSPDMVQVLMDLGARVNAQDGWGKTPLQRAVSTRFEGRAEVVRVLLAHGADATAVGVNSGGSRREGITMLMMAASIPAPDMKEVVECLLAAGADPNVRSHFGYTALGFLLRSFVMRYSDSLWHANMIEAAAVLLEHGADPTINSTGTGPPIDYVRRGLWSFDSWVRDPLTRVFEEWDQSGGQP